jgi:hypothetical protein
VPITTDVASSNPDQGEVYNIFRVSRCRPLKEWIEREPNDIVITCDFFRSALKYISMTILPSFKANGLVWFNGI